jgi:hypothetical protein
MITITIGETLNKTKELTQFWKIKPSLVTLEQTWETVTGQPTPTQNIFSKL